MPESMKGMSPELLEALIDNPYECPVVIDKDGVVRYMSRFNEKVYGLTQKEAIGRHITKVIRNTKMHEVLLTGKAQIGKAMRIGSRQRIVARIPLKDRSGRILGVLGKLMFHQTDKIRDLYYQMEVLKEQVRYYKREVDELKEAHLQWEKILGQSPLMMLAKKEALKAASSDAPVLICGESGTGKELFASAIHYSSKRAKGPFIKMNCAAIPYELIESELFGYEPGAFTGARPKGKPGKFELANNGTLFLDEIGDMPLSTQAKILRVIQEKEVERLGGTKSIRLDFRVIAATNKDLSEEIMKGSFRSDLYFRLKIFHITTPPLREIREDVPRIAYYLLSSMREKKERAPARFSERVMGLFNTYPWPGNVRELKNVIERAIYVSDGPEILVEDLPREIQAFESGPVDVGEAQALTNALMVAEKACILNALKKANGNKALASKLLGIHRSGLYQKMRRYGIRY